MTYKADNSIARKSEHPSRLILDTILSTLYFIVGGIKLIDELMETCHEPAALLFHIFSHHITPEANECIRWWARLQVSHAIANHYNCFVPELVTKQFHDSRLTT